MALLTSPPPDHLLVQCVRFSGVNKDMRHIALPSSGVDLRPLFITDTDVQAALLERRLPRAADDAPPLPYDVVGVLLHGGGSTRGGHYVSCVQVAEEPGGGQWVMTNDDVVTPIAFKDVAASAAGGQVYLLLLRRRGPSAGAAAPLVQAVPLSPPPAAAAAAPALGAARPTSALAADAAPAPAPAPAPAAASRPRAAFGTAPAAVTAASTAAAAADAVASASSAAASDAAVAALVDAALSSPTDWIHTPLSPAAAAHVEALLSGGKDGTPAALQLSRDVKVGGTKLYCTTVTVGGLRRLRPAGGRETYLNDEIINTVLALLVAWQRRRFPPPSAATSAVLARHARCGQLGPMGATGPMRLFIPFTMFLSDFDRTYPGWGEEQCRAKAQRHAIRDGFSFTGYDGMLLATHLRESEHWVTMVLRWGVGGSDGGLHVYDSSPRCTQQRDLQACVSLARRWVGWVSGGSVSAASWPLILHPTPQQDNFVDCGVFMLTCCLFIAAGKPFAFSSADAPALRRLFAHMLLTTGAYPPPP